MPSNIYKSEPAIGKSEKGQANGVSTLDASGHVPGSQLDIVNALDSTSTDKPLSAAQGKVLNDQIATHDIASNTDLNSLTEPGDYGCALNNTAATLSHCPVSKAFTMRVMRYGAS